MIVQIIIISLFVLGGILLAVRKIKKSKKKLKEGLGNKKPKKKNRKLKEWDKEFEAEKILFPCHLEDFKNKQHFEEFRIATARFPKIQNKLEKMKVELEIKNG